jgi:superfamily II DNA or RNA helicase
MLALLAPTELRLGGYEKNRALLAETLTYTDKRVDYEYRKAKASKGWFVRVHGQAAYDERIAALEAERKKSLLYEDAEGLWTRSGVHPLLARVFDDKLVRSYELPAPRVVPWAKMPEHQDRYYQVAAHDALLAAAQNGPACVEIGTGLGKSRIIRNLIKSLGLQAVVMAPSKNIAQQLFDDLTLHFGSARVGFFGDGKKQYSKLITVAIGASLTRVEPGSPIWEKLSQARVFIADESHLCPAATLEKVCFGLQGSAPYRFFFSGTQMRNDGLDLVLDGITGPCVYSMTVREGVDQGFLSKPVFRTVWMDSKVLGASGRIYDSDDANDLTRAHVFYNPDVNARAAEFANKSVSMLGRPTVILVEEMEQFGHLLPLLRYEARFAHGGVTKENKDKIPEQYHDSDPKALVAAFNRNEFPILVGTSCIVTGTDIQAAQTIIFLRGGKSEIEVKQAIGRGTRLFPGKNDCIFLDFGISNVETLERHANARIKIFDDVYPSHQELRL